MKKFFARLREALIKLKIYIARTGNYIGLVNTVLILFLFLSGLEKYGIDIEIEDLILPFFVLGVLLMVLFGFLEEKLGFYGEEQKVAYSRNPYMQDIVERLDRIERKLAKKK
jgi:hypothetical protein